MGNTASSSGKNAHGHNIRDETVDFGHLSPQGIYTGPQDWNQQVVGKLIVDRKLAPFYRPLEDYESDWDDETILRNRKLKPGEEALPPPVTMSVSGPTPLSGKISGKGKGVADRRESARMSEAEVYHGATECPICFMYYPPNMNRSRCCDQAICTECFVQIKRAEPTTTHLVSESAACPYCVQENFGVTYEPPSWRAGLVMNTSGSSRPEMSRLGGSAMSTDSQGPLASERTRRKSVPYQAGEVVTVDLIRPDWEAKLEAVRAAVTRRANRRIVMRQVGDRLIPVGITSGRVVPVNIAGGEADGSGGRRSRRQRNGHGSGDLPMGMSGHDLEELMMMEAMRLSLLEHEAQQQRQASARNTASNPDAASSRETSNASPDPASQLSQDDLPQSSHATEREPSFSTTVTDPASSSGANTPLNANHSRILAAASDHSSTVSPRASFDASQATPPFHNRSGSGPLHIASSPLNGAAGLAMAVGLPAPNEPSDLGETSQAGIPPRTLDTISAAVGASTFPAVILGSGMDNLSVVNSSAISQEGAKARQVNPSTEPPFVSTMAPSIEREKSLSAGQASPPVGDSTGNTAQSSHEKSVDAPHAKSAGALGSSLPDPFGLGFTLDGASAHSPIASQVPGIQHEPSAAFLTAAARTMTNSSSVTADSQQSRGENYDVLLSSPETETDEPLMSGPPNLARLNTMDSYSGASGSN